MFFFQERKSNAPTIYLPPIGIRLVKKYVGLDFKRMSLAGDAEHQRRFSTALSTTFQTLNKPSVAHVNETNKSVRRHSLKGKSKKTAKDWETKLSKSRESTTSDVFLIRDGPTDSVQEKPNITINVEDADTTEMKETAEEESDKPVIKGNQNKQDAVATTDMNQQPMLVRERPLDDTVIMHLDKKERDGITVELENSSAVLENEQVKGVNEVVLEDTDKETSSVNVDDDPENMFIDTTYNLEERRSSRSTFRPRNSVRLRSQTSFLSEHNMEVIGIAGGKSKDKKSVKNKEKLGNFYLDYGDGKLHDSLEIPRIKDCSRTWCNPHCKTCKLRTPGGPCFVLIPVDEAGRRRKLPMDKRLSTFGKYMSATNDQSKVGQQLQNETAKSKSSELKQGGVKVSEYGTTETNTADADVADNEERKGEIVGAKKDHETDKPNDNKEDGEQLEETPAILQLVNKNKEQRKTEKTYSRKRLEELAQPRGGPPAEVRFSKTSLRKKQELMIETERTKAWTLHEKENLAYIQNKISLFLALLNQQELTKMPTNMVALPIREQLSTKVVKIKKPWVVRKRNGIRKVNFSPQTRFRLLS